MINWHVAITRNREALSRILAALFAMAGLSGGEAVATLPRHLRNQVLRLLRPAESAVRRLVIIAARDLVVVVAPARSKQATTPSTTTSKPPRSVILGLEPRTHSGESAKRSKGKNAAIPSNGTAEIRLHGVGPRKQRRRFACLGIKPEDDALCSTSRPIANIVPSLPLLDPRKRFDVRPRRRRAKSFPRITFIGLTEPTPIPDDWIPSPDDPVGAARLCRRLAALKRALDDLPGQARRLARWRARRDLALTAIQGEFASASAAKLKGANHRYRRFNPMRPGWPPGRRKRPIHEVDDVLAECHTLALAIERDDTS